MSRNEVLMKRAVSYGTYTVREKKKTIKMLPTVNKDYHFMGKVVTFKNRKKIKPIQAFFTTIYEINRNFY